MEHALIAACAFDSRIISLSFKNISVVHPVHPKKDSLSHVKGVREAKILCVCSGGFKKSMRSRGMA